MGVYYPGVVVEDIHYMVIEVLDASNTVVKYENLPVPGELPPYGVLHEGVAVLHNIGFDGQAVYGRCFERRDIPDTRKRHMQGAGMGVAERASTFTLFLRTLIFSLCSTPKRCSSSRTRSPRSWKTTSLLKILCVATITLVSPFSIRLSASFIYSCDTKRESISIFMPKGANLCFMVL